MQLIDQFMKPHQEEAKEFGDAANEATLVLALLSKVINDAAKPLRGDDTSNGVRACSK